MAGFGTMGGASSFPQRIGAPQSQNIQTNQEWDTDWQNKLGSIRPTISDGKTQLDLLPGSSGYNEKAAAPIHNQIKQQYEQNPIFGSFESSAYANENAANRGASHLVDRWWTSSWKDNPEYLEAQAEYENQSRMRGENQLRQNQAYGSMLGNGQLNGVIGPDYTAPQFGQVSGQGPTQMPSIDGVGTDWTQSLGTQNGDGSFGAAQGQTGIFGSPTPQNKRWGL